MERGAALPADVAAGDVLLGLALRWGAFERLFAGAAHCRRFGAALGRCLPVGRGYIGAVLLTPTRLYVKAALAAITAGGVHGFAHITGGGLTENLPRVLPKGLGAKVDLNSWDLPGVFQWLKDQGRMSEAEMLKTFNAGIGMVVVVSSDSLVEVTSALQDEGQTVVPIGTVIAGDGIVYSGSL